MASLVIAVVVAGTMSAFIVAGRIVGEQNSSIYAEAAACAQQKLEQFRNHVAADVAGGDTFLQDKASLGWQTEAGDDLSDCGSSNNSSMSIRDAAAPPVRKYCVKPGDCDGDTLLAGDGEADCYALLTQVCWNGTPCPADGEAC